MCVRVLEAEGTVEAQVVLTSNLPVEISCPHLQLAVEPAAKKEAHNNKKDDIKPDKLVSW